MKLKKIMLSFLSLFLLNSCNVIEKNEDKMKDIPFTQDYAFSSKIGFYSYNESYKYIDLFNEKGIKNATIETYKVIDKKIFHLLRIVENDIDYFKITSLNIINKNLEILDNFSYMDLINRNLITSDFIFEEIYTSFVSTSKDIFSFKILFYNNSKIAKKIQFAYNTSTSDLIYEGNTTNQFDYQNKLNGGYEIEYPYDDLFLITINAQNYQWIITNDTLLMDENFKKIKENIYPKSELSLKKIIWYGELFFQAQFSDGSFMGSLNSKNTVPMIFKANCENKTVEYLGYLPLSEDLKGIFIL